MQRITNETNTLCTVTTSFLVVLDSVNASVKNNGDWNSDVTFDFESPIEKPINSFLMSMAVQQFNCPNSLYNINEKNNLLHIREVLPTTPITYGDYNISIPYGNYNVNTFNTQLFTLLSTATGSNRFSMTFNKLNNKFTLVNSTNEFTIKSDSTINNVMGLKKATDQSSVLKILACPYNCNFNGIESINISLNNIQTPNIDSYHKSNAHIVQTISVDSTLSSITYEKSNDYGFKLTDHVFENLQVQITTGENNLVNLNNQDWNMTLVFSIMYDVNRFDHQNTFHNVLQYGYYGYNV